MFDIITNKYDTSRECTRMCINMDPIEMIKLYTDWWNHMVLLEDRLKITPNV